ncbi:hypothetical protein RT717_10730 [Imperialibacter roseus]|uniref:DUF1579 domain-containing protein n=1 Tax=Imperialibacter roseus TaxID=1324217 RepID=A0ABZ0IVV1_9BACT|nr:hypothetical protein [Imperialibacter roseus]WOK09109.1 hypothetical protein RT717_10730 [Imperialibacter roseus]
MANLTGKWEGEYSVNIGSDEQPEVEYHAFTLEMLDIDGELTGTAQDLTLSDEPSNISGFHDDGFISFIKKYNRLVFVESDEYFGDNSIEHPDIHYSGTFDENENSFQGTWEIHEDQERDGLQDSFDDMYNVGNWWMKLTN